METFTKIIKNKRQKTNYHYQGYNRHQYRSYRNKKGLKKDIIKNYANKFDNLNEIEK